MMAYLARGALAEERRLPPAVTNGLLRRLPPDERETLLAKMTLVEVKARRVLHYPNMEVEHVYFPESAIISVMADTGAGRGAETWLIGPEGFVGLPAILGYRRSFHRRVVQVGGTAWRMSIADLREAFDDHRSVRDAILAYAGAVLLQASQLAACNVQHPLQQRIARWLLMSADRNRGPDIPVTHETLARLLGVRRATVTDCIATLVAAEAVKTARSTVRVADRPRLLALTCPCYRIISAADRPLFEH